MLLMWVDVGFFFLSFGLSFRQLREEGFIRRQGEFTAHGYVVNDSENNGWP